MFTLFDYILNAFSVGMVGTCSASTCKSGSETVIRNPSMKNMIRGIRIFLFLLKDLPIPSPSGSIDIVEPTVKKLIPRMSITVPSKNITSTPASSGIKVTDSTRTIRAIGMTEPNAYLIDEKMCDIIYYS